MSTILSAPHEEDAGDVAQLVSQSGLEPVQAASVPGDSSFPGVDVEKNVRPGRDSYTLVASLVDERVWIGLAEQPTSAFPDWTEHPAGEMGTPAPACSSVHEERIA